MKKTLIEAKPELLEEWHQEKNKKLDSMTILAQSNIKVWWKCKANSEHEWESPIKTRVNSSNSSCPYCSGRKVSSENNLEVTYPNIAAQWHPKLNGLLTPKDVTFKTTKKVWWICNHNHEWEAPVGNRTLRGSGCPVCTGKKVSNKTCLQTLNPSVASQWHLTKNVCLKPTDVTPQSNKKVWWQCSDKPEHEWEAVVFSRTNGSSCPMCNKINKGEK